MRSFAARFPRHALPLQVISMLALLATSAVAAGPAHRYTLDPAGSQVSARVGFFGIASKTAQFPEVSGGVALDPGRPDAIDLDVTLNARALRAGDKVTLARLKGPKFFDVERYPTVRYVGRSMTMTGPQQADVAGEMTARGITRPAALKVTFDRDPAQITGREPVTLSGTMTINRRDFGMTAYSLIVGKKVTITIKARMVPT